MMNPEEKKVTLADELRIDIHEGKPALFAGWTTQFELLDEAGEMYSLAVTVMHMEQRGQDVFITQLCKGRGETKQLPNSIYKVTRFPNMQFDHVVQGRGRIVSFTQTADQAVLTVAPEYTLTMTEDGVWHLEYQSEDGRLKADIRHKPAGFPEWYGRTEPIMFSPHCLQYGYAWSGAAEGTLTFEGKTFAVTGSGIRERAVSVDNSTAEVGAWEDWGQIHFHELATELWHMRLMDLKGMHIYDIERETEYQPTELTIQHTDWSYVKGFDGFLPMTYFITEKFDGGVLTIEAHITSSIFWGVTHQLPENPCATVLFENVTGTLKFDDGTERTLTGGMGSMAVRQWHAYPSILPVELMEYEEGDNHLFASF